MSASVTNLREYLMIVPEKQPRCPWHSGVTTPDSYMAAQTSAGLTQFDYTTPVDQTGGSVTNCLFIRIDGGNAFKMRPKPVTQDIFMGGGLATIGQTVSGRTEIVGTLQTKLYYSQIPLLLGWACTPINSARTLPWTSIAPATGGLGGAVIGDLPTCTLYHAIKRADGSYRCRGYFGTKVMGGTLSCNQNDQIATLSLNLQAMEAMGDGNLWPTNSGTLLVSTGGSALVWGTDPTQVDAATLNDASKIPDPGSHAFPFDPVLFSHSKGLMQLYPSSDTPSPAYRTEYSSFSLNFGNKVDARSFENRWVTRMLLCGRQATLNATLLYKPPGASGAGGTLGAAHEDRYFGETLQGMKMVFGFANGTTTAHAVKDCTFSFNAQNVIRDLDDDTPVDRYYEQHIVVQNIYDPAAASGAGEDFDVAFTSHA